MPKPYSYDLRQKVIQAIRPLAKVFFARVGKREKVKGERDNTKPLPFPPYPFPDLCKKSIELDGLKKSEASLVFNISRNTIEPI